MQSPATRKFWKNEPFLGGLALMLLMLGCFFILQPFLTALVWAIILAYSLHPLQRRFTRWFRGRRTLAACLVTLTVTVLIAGPVTLIGMSVAQDGRDLAVATRNWFMAMPDEPPPWVNKTPLFGDEVSNYWKGFTDGRKRWMEQLDKEVTAPPPRAKIVTETGDGLVVGEPAPLVKSTPGEEAANDARKVQSSHTVALVGKFLTWARSALLIVGKTVLQSVSQVVVSAFLAFFLLRDSPELSRRLEVSVERLAGDRGRHLIKVAGNTVRGVIYGVLGTALAQALVAGLGFWVAGVPGVVLLAVLTFLLAVLPLGPPIIWIPASMWLFAQGKPGHGLVMLIYGLLVISGVDNFLRPYLISQGNKMPFALVFCGVVGGALAFGLVGVFLGPTLLAVAFRLVDEWSSLRPGADEEKPLRVISELQISP